MKIKSLSIFVFAYNEAGNLSNVIEDIACFLKKNVEDGELVVVNDGSTDNTRDIVQDLQKLNLFRYIEHDQNRGIGQALKTGYKNTTKNFVVGIPGDAQFNVDELLQIKDWEEEFFYSFYRKNKHYNWYRTFLTSFNLIFNKICLKNSLKDVNWIKVYSKKQLAAANPELDSSLIESEISSKLIKKGYCFIEYPSEYHPRVSGKSKGGNVYTLTKALLEMLKLINVVRKF